MNILLTGGSGLLGGYLQKLLTVDAPSHKELDITEPITSKKTYDLIIHSAAYTDVPQAEIDKKGCYAVNVSGTRHLLEHFPNTPFVYISSEYAKNPTNYYAETKKMGEQEVIERAKKYLIIRTLFKPNPFPFPKAFVDQYTQGDYVDVIAPLIVKKILKWDRSTKEMCYIGTGRKTIYELAKRTRPDVGKLSIKDIGDVTIPQDYL